MSNITESLHAGDLENLVSHIFEIDSYTSKMGNDRDIVVLSFTVDTREAANDLVNFIERGYEFVLDADSGPGELIDGNYRVFVEIERSRHISKNILEILHGLTMLTSLENFKFRYYKSFKSLPATEENLSSIIPTNKNDYDVYIKENSLNNFSNFFNRSYVESISVDEDDITFQKLYSDPLRMRIRGFGPTQEVYESIPGKIMLESKDISEVIYLSKFLGNYNITKLGGVFVFENDKFAVALERL